MQYHVRHETRYKYTEPVTLCHNELRMNPTNSVSQRCLSSTVYITPECSAYAERYDYFGNKVVYFDVEDPHEELVVTVQSVVETGINEPMQGSKLAWRDVQTRLRRGDDQDLRQNKLFTLASPMIPLAPELAEIAKPVFEQESTLFGIAQRLTAFIFEEFEYDPEATTIATPLTEVIQNKRGVCQDFAHLGIAVMRSMGLAAAYVSGYLETLPPPGQTKLRGADASHAWFSVYFPGTGWVDFDPTNNQMLNQRYVQVARGRDFSDVSPLKGIVFGGGAMQLTVGVDVEPQELPG